MHKDQYTDAPSQEQVRVKTMLNTERSPHNFPKA